MKSKSPVKRKKWANKEMQEVIDAVKSGMGLVLELLYISL